VSKNTLYEIDRYQFHAKNWEDAFINTEQALMKLKTKGYPNTELLIESLRGVDRLISERLSSREVRGAVNLITRYLRKAKNNRMLIRALRNPKSTSDLAVCTLIKRASYEIEQAVQAYSKSCNKNIDAKYELTSNLSSALFSLLSAATQAQKLS